MSAPTMNSSVLAHVEPNFGLFPGLEGMRKRALEAAQTAGFPHHDNEEYKYTSLRHLGEVAWKPAQDSNFQAADINALGALTVDSHRIVVVNGVFRPELSTIHAVDGLDVLPLEVAIAEGFTDGKLGALASLDTQHFSVTAHLGKLKKPAVPMTAALATALFTSGVYIRLAANTVVEKPIKILHVHEGTDVVTAPRVLVDVCMGAEATLVESYYTFGEKRGLTLPVVEVFVAPNAKLEHIKLQRESIASQHIALTEVKQQGDSSYIHFNVIFGGGLTRNDINVFLDGSNTHLRMDGVTCISGEQHVDNHTRLDHAKPHCESFEIYKHLLDEKSTAVFNGKIFVHEDAQKTDAKQTNQTVLLSPNAVMNTKPQLEIFADDVKCTHGATVGQMRKDELFYLRSRGIPLAKARALMVYAFAAEVLELISHEEIKRSLEQYLFEKLGVDGA